VVISQKNAIGLHLFLLLEAHSGMFAVMPSLGITVGMA
jgi:hypothetical protein